MRTSMATMALVLSLFMAGCGTVGLELAQCQPDGYINSVSASLDPKQFWIDQVAVLKKKIKQWDLAGKLQKCESERSEDQSRNCVVDEMDRYTAVEKCLEHAVTVCRMHGGC